MSIRVWLVTTGEPFPMAGSDRRLMRAGMLAKHLASRGHEVTWWTSAFDHLEKRHLSRSSTAVEWLPGVTLRLVRALGYRRNVSLARMVDHWLVARRFEELAEAAAPPQLILASMPTIDLAHAATRIGTRYGIPVVLDIRDLWPDVYLELVPEWMRPVASVAVGVLRRGVRSACKSAFAITGNAPNFVEWGLRLGTRAPNRYDRYFPFGYSLPQASEERTAAARQFWRDHGLSRQHDELVGCYFGSIGYQSDFETIIEAARMLSGSSVKFRMVFCGTGDRLEELRHKAADVPEVVFTGWVEQPEILELMSIAQFGVAAYWSHSGYVGNLPNKPIEYLAGGLPVVTCLSGFLSDFITEHRCGFSYDAEDPGSLARLIQRLAGNRQQLQNASKNAREIFQRSFDVNVVYDSMVGYLEDIVASTSTEAREIDKVVAVE